MKFRLKGDAFKTARVVEFDGTNVLVSELKCRVCEILRLQEEDMRDIILSMNGKHVLSAEDSQTMSSLGFVSGDSVYILGVQSQEPSAKAIKYEDTATSILYKQEESNQSSVAQQPSTSQEMEGYREEKLGIHADKHYIPIADTPSGIVPKALQKIMQNSSLSFSSLFEEVACLIHILMVETGFIPVAQNTEQDAYITLPDSWHIKHGILKLHYKAALSPNAPCLLIISAMQPLSLLTIHGLASGGIEKSMKLKLSDYLPITGGNRLRQLSLSFKNEISFPLLVNLQRQVEGVCPANLSNLPAEMLNSILARLDEKSLCRLSATSRFFREVGNQPDVWKKLVLRDYRDKYSQLSKSITNWKQIYQDEYRLAHQRRPAFTGMAYYRPPWNPFGYLGGPFSHPQDDRSRITLPGIIGGEQDLRPNFGPFAPPSRRDPFHRGTGLPPFMENRNRNFPPF